MKLPWLRIAIAPVLAVAIAGTGVYASISTWTGVSSQTQGQIEPKAATDPKENPSQTVQSVEPLPQTEDLQPPTTSPTAPPNNADNPKEEPALPKPNASPTEKQVVSRSQPTAVGTGAAAYDWWTQASKYWPRDTSATVIDVRTGVSFKVLRTMGTNHADVEPVTTADSEAIKRAWGGNFSWDRRPVVVVFGNYRMAAGMTSMPEGSEKITNNGATGHMNIHFLNSRTHGTNRVDSKYQTAIKEAVGH